MDLFERAKNRLAANHFHRTALGNRLAGRCYDVIEWVERVVCCHHNARVLADMEYRLGCYLNHTTDRMSKPYYELEEMIACYDERQSERDDDEFAEDLELGIENAMAPYRVLVPAKEWKRKKGAVLWWRVDPLTGKLLDSTPYAGTPYGINFSKPRHPYYTHFTLIPQPGGDEAICDVVGTAWTPPAGRIDSREYAPPIINPTKPSVT